MTTIPTAQESKTSWMNLLLRHCFRLNNKSFDTILIGGSLITDLTRYPLPIRPDLLYLDKLHLVEKGNF